MSLLIKRFGIVFFLLFIYLYYRKGVLIYQVRKKRVGLYQVRRKGVQFHSTGDIYKKGLGFSGGFERVGVLLTVQELIKGVHVVSRARSNLLTVQRISNKRVLSGDAKIIIVSVNGTKNAQEVMFGGDQPLSSLFNGAMDA